MKLSVIFEERPRQWGFRGDPYFWDHLKERAETMEPISPDELETWIRQEYLSVAGKALTDQYGDFAVVRQKSRLAALTNIGLPDHPDG